MPAAPAPQQCLCRPRRRHRSNRDGLPLADQYDEPVASRHADVEQAALHAYCEI